jgi:hypothetical protein
MNLMAAGAGNHPLMKDETLDFIIQVTLINDSMMKKTFIQ